MLPKENRADKKAVETIFRRGTAVNTQSLTFRFIKIQEPKRRISVIVPKNIAKLAVKRNSLRRRGYHVLKKYLNQFPSATAGVIVFKKYQDNASIIENEIKNILIKIN